MTDQKLATELAALRLTLHVTLTLLTERRLLKPSDADLIRKSVTDRQRDGVDIPVDEPPHHLN